ncbi:hypothetical protein GPL15_20770 [Clostridium sp. MCC353]|uniref:hypothetical protein n=1 Tax=Clostridium sp. MCC353 TaxID=2592646 RepID=UPI001C029855|nr:hypothetical protein [Clostridium sp. MCC353]MBT9778913.1 hypothetical protein [Clostridium sp. MCC353]
MENNTKDKKLRDEIKKGIIMSLAALLVCIILGISNEALFSLSAILLVFIFIPIIIDNNIYSIIRKALGSVILIVTGAFVIAVFGKEDYPLAVYVPVSLIIVSASFVKYKYKLWKNKY